MYSYKINKQPKSTTEINIIISKFYLEKEKKSAFKRLQLELVVDGYRKGKVPEAIAKKHLKDDQILSETIKKILPEIYSEIVKKESLKPIINPKIDLIKPKNGEDWEIKILIAEKPEIILGQYKEVIKKLKADKKKADIWIPGKDKEKKSESENNSQLINEILNLVLKEIKVEISDLIIDEELEYRLSKLIDDIRTAGLTMDTYLKSKNLTMDQLKQRFKKEIEDTYKLEFILMEIADKENIKVENHELDKVFSNIKDEKQRVQAQSNSYFYASILRKQKAIDFLLNL